MKKYGFMALAILAIAAFSLAVQTDTDEDTFDNIIIIGKALIGDATPTQTLGDEDLYIEGICEIDDRLYADGGATIATQFTAAYATATTVPYFDASKHLISSAVTPTELGYLSGVTSAIQTQIGTLAPATSPTFATSATFGYATATTVPYFDAGKGLVSSAVTPTELGYLSGVTGAIQTQIGTLAPATSPTFATSATFGYATATTVPYFDAGKGLVSSAVTPTELGYLSGVTGAIQTQIGAKWTPAAATVAAGANTACTTTCTTHQCVFGQDSDSAGIIVACDSAAADVCVCVN